MIKLFGFGQAFGVVDPSPFVAKIDAFLRISGLPYELVGDPNKLRKAPKGKLPIIEDDGRVVADSYFIEQYLTEKYKLEIDNHLSPMQRGLSHLMTKSLDENFYWCLVYSRWMRNDTWPLVKKEIFKSLPVILRLILPGIAHRGVKSALIKHGIGRHSDSELMQIFEHSLQSMNNVLGENNYFFGDKISSFDATAYGFLASFILVDLDNPFNQLARSYQSLVDYCKRIQQEYYSSTNTPAAAVA